VAAVDEARSNALTTAVSLEEKAAQLLEQRDAAQGALAALRSAAEKSTILGDQRAAVSVAIAIQGARAEAAADAVKAARVRDEQMEQLEQQLAAVSLSAEARVRDMVAQHAADDVHVQADAKASTIEAEDVFAVKLATMEQEHADATAAAHAEANAAHAQAVLEASTQSDAQLNAERDRCEEAVSVVREACAAAIASAHHDEEELSSEKAAMVLRERNATLLDATHAMEKLRAESAVELAALEGKLCATAAQHAEDAQNLHMAENEMVAAHKYALAEASSKLAALENHASTLAEAHADAMESVRGEQQSVLSKSAIKFAVLESKMSAMQERIRDGSSAALEAARAQEARRALLMLGTSGRGLY
jgi:hypothetical protein